MVCGLSALPCAKNGRLPHLHPPFVQRAGPLGLLRELHQLPAGLVNLLARRARELSRLDGERRDQVAVAQHLSSRATIAVLGL